ncbi:hypothetical protein B0H11DRAFT_1931114 [Mycena galericulata]|nr:hypothetical protein B0H11DRAFT_1931114 [Mycena galericulata]
MSREHPEHPRSGLERCAGGSQRGRAEPKPSREAATEQIWDVKDFLRNSGIITRFWQAGTGSGKRGGPNEEAEVKKSPIITGTNNAIPSNYATLLHSLHLKQTLRGLKYTYRGQKHRKG